jgi:TRAP transporter TAXI family solute receptor
VIHASDLKKTAWKLGEHQRKEGKFMRGKYLRTFGLMLGLIGSILFLSQTEALSAGKTYLNIGGAGSGGRWFMEASAIAELFTKKIEQVRATPVVVPGVGVGNIKKMNKNELEIGTCISDEAWSGFYGKPPYFKAGDKQKIYAWYKQLPMFVTIVADKSLKKVEDLKGKKIGIGLPGTGDAIQATALLKMYGLDANKDYEPRNLGREQALNSLIDGRIDAVIITFSRNNPNHQGRAFAARPGLHEITISREIAEKFIKKFPYYGIDEKGDPKLGFPNITRITTPVYKIINPRLSEDLVYLLTKTLWTNIDELYLRLPWYKEEDVTLQTAVQGVVIPFHPGAKKYYVEKGVLKK